ncbi:MAG TPA: amidohydrolase family protein [Flavobacteriaceae bacterium]|nr:amidohydrolase family protein [Flavobacteriaceae bacterium]
MKKLILSYFIFFFIIAGCSKIITLPEDVTIISNVNVVTMDSDTLLANHSVIVQGDSILMVIPNSKIKIPAKATVIDGTGKYLMPGLVDMHTHIRDTSNLSKYIRYGVTTVRDMAGNIGTPLAWRNQIIAGKLTGPRIIAASPFVSNEDGFPKNAETIDSAKASIRAYHQKGYDLIKAFRMRPEIFKAVMQEANALGITVSGHLPDRGISQALKGNYDIPIDIVLESGFKSIEHLNELILSSFREEWNNVKMEKLAAKIASSNTAVTTLIGTDIIIASILQPGGEKIVDSLANVIEKRGVEGELEGFKNQTNFIINSRPPIPDALSTRVPEFTFKILRALDEAGVTLLAGTDSHNPLFYAGESLHFELEQIARAGLTPYQVLEMSTTNAAKFLGKKNQFGKVVKGLKADMILLDQNPLLSISATRSIRGVMLNGEWFEIEQLN